MPAAQRPPGTAHLIINREKESFFGTLSLDAAMPDGEIPVELAYLQPD